MRLKNRKTVYAVIALLLLTGMGIIIDMLPEPPPEAPDGLVAYAGVGLATLIWEPSAEDVIAYRVYVSVEGSETAGELAGSTNRSRFTVFDLDAGTTYRFTVSALSSYSEGEGSSAIATPLAADGDLVVHFIDVGQGDSILIQTPDDKTILIDSGKGSAHAALKTYIDGLGITVIDVLVATHPDEDHIGGLDKILGDYDVMSVYDSGFRKDTQVYNRFLQAAEDERAETGCTFHNNSNLKAGTMLNWSVGVHFLLVHINASAKAANDASIVLMMSYGTVDFLLTGDAEGKAESIILSSFDIDVEILKVGHHGSRSSSGAPFLAATTPEVAVISAGAGNSYGHPHQETLDGLSSIGADVYRTDLHGSVVITSDSVGWSIAHETLP